jgi:hypothetical protein
MKRGGRREKRSKGEEVGDKRDERETKEEKD